MDDMIPPAGNSDWSYGPTGLEDNLAVQSDMQQQPPMTSKAAATMPIAPAGITPPPAQQDINAVPAGYRIVDVADAAHKFCKGVDKLSYTKHLQQQAPQHKLAKPGDRLPPNVQASVIKHKLCTGSHTLSSCLHPTPTPDGLSCRDLRLDDQGLLLPESTAVSQFSFSLVKAVHVGPSGFLKSRGEPLRSVARIILFDRQHNRFLGPAHSICTSSTRHKEGSWYWDPSGVYPPSDLPAGLGLEKEGMLSAAAVGGREAALGGGVGDLAGANACIVRCCGMQGDPVSGSRAIALEQVSLYVELNVAYPLTGEDKEAVPQNEAQARKLVDELTTCWALIRLDKCAQLTREMEITVPLYMGSLYDPAKLRKLWDADARLHPIRTFFAGPRAPVLVFRAGPLPHKPAPLLPYSLMPPTMVATRDMAYALAAFRLLLTQRLAPFLTSSASNSSTGTTTTTRPSQVPLLAAQQEPSSTTDAAAAGGGGRSAGAVAVAGQRTACSPYDMRQLVLGDPVLASFAPLLEDELLLAAMQKQWQARCKEMCRVPSCLATCGDISSITPAPTLTQILTAFQASVLEVAPLLRCASLPPRHMSNFTEYNAARSRQAIAYCCKVDAKTGKALERQHPVEPLSRGAHAFLHQPFDVREVRLCLQRGWAKEQWRQC